MPAPATRLPEPRGGAGDSTPQGPGVGDALAKELVETIQSIRSLDLRKSPSIGETLDWARSLVVLGAPSLDKELIEETLSVIVKYDRDAEKVLAPPAWRQGPRPERANRREATKRCTRCTALHHNAPRTTAPWHRLDFVQVLRRHQVRVSPAESWMPALEQTGLGERGVVRDQDHAHQEPEDIETSTGFLYSGCGRG